MNSREWNNFVNNHETTIYHTYEWGEILKKVHGHDVFYISEKNGIFPVAFVKSIIFGNRLISMPFADYGGPCAINKETTRELINNVVSLSEKMNLDFIEIRSPDEKYFKEFEQFGFVARKDYCTFILDLRQSLDELWKGMEKRTRNDVTKSQKTKFKIIDVQNLEELREFYELYLSTMKNLGSPPQPFEFFKYTWEKFHPNKIKIRLVEYEKNKISGMVFFYHNNKVHFSYSCSNRKFSKLRANDFLLWDTIKNAKKDNYKFFDFGRTRKNSGVYFYKKGWGGKETPMTYFYKFYKKELKERQEIKYKKISDLWSRYMPHRLARKIGPWVIKQIG
jgi:FemAB-related protein (PEP-CTERM system-associated)